MDLWHNERVDRIPLIDIVFSEKNKTLNSVTLSCPVQYSVIPSLAYNTKRLQSLILRRCKDSIIQFLSNIFENLVNLEVLCVEIRKSYVDDDYNYVYNYENNDETMNEISNLKKLRIIRLTNICYCPEILLSLSEIYTLEKVELFVVGKMYYNSEEVIFVHHFLQNLIILLTFFLFSGIT